MPVTTGSGGLPGGRRRDCDLQPGGGRDGGGRTVSISATLSARRARWTTTPSRTRGRTSRSTSGTATWTTNAASKTYGDLDPVPLTTGSGTNFLAADGVTATYSRVAGENGASRPYHDHGDAGATAGVLTTTPSRTRRGIYHQRAGGDLDDDGGEQDVWGSGSGATDHGEAGRNFLAADGVTATYSRVAGETVSPPTYHITATLARRRACWTTTHHERRGGIYDQQARRDLDDERGEQDIWRSGSGAADHGERKLRGRRRRDGDVQPRGGRERWRARRITSRPRWRAAGAARQLHRSRTLVRNSRSISASRAGRRTRRARRMGIWIRCR